MHQAALVGISGYGRRHLELLSQQIALGQLRLRAAVVVNPDAERAECERLRAAGCAIYPDVDSLWRHEAGRIDLCCLPTPIHMHRQMAVSALEAGANVLVEKPVAATVQDVDAIAAAARATNRWIAVGFQDVYASEVQALKRRLLAGTLGPLRKIVACVAWPRDLAYFRRNDWGGRVRLNRDWVLDSPLNNATAHYLMLMLFLAGESFDRAADVGVIEGELYRSQPIESFDTAGVRLHTTTGVELVMLCTLSTTETIEPEVRLECKNASAVWRYQVGVELTHANREKETLPALDEFATRSHMMSTVTRRLSDPSVFICTPEIAREHTRCINTLHEHMQIHALADRWLVRRDTATGGQVGIANIARALLHAADSGQLFSEAGLPWAQPATCFTLSGYREFLGGLAAG